jgi:plasmid stabilization system protein ParE
MAQPRASRTTSIACTQLVTRFDRNGERAIDLPLLRRVRRHITRDMRAAGARGSMVWRLARTPSGITVAAVWHPRRDQMIALAQAPRADRQQRRRLAARAGIVNRRRVGHITVPNYTVPSITGSGQVALAA